MSPIVNEGDGMELRLLATLEVPVLQCAEATVGGQSQSVRITFEEITSFSKINGITEHFFQFVSQGTSKFGLDH